MSDIPRVGKIYKVVSDRKGTFFMKVTATDKEWTSGIVTDGVARAIMQYNVKYEGDNVTVRNSMSLFYEMGDKNVDNAKGKAAHGRVSA